MKTVGITACSDGLKPAGCGEISRLCTFLEATGHTVQCSSCLYETRDFSARSGKKRGDALMKMFADPEMTDIYDVSGGDMANEVLDYLDFDQIRASRAVFWGYSDLTTVINAIYAKTLKSSVLYQVRNLVHGDCQDIQRRRFLSRAELFQPRIQMVQGHALRGTVIGGNVRCFLKLAGTGYFPDPTDKVLLLEALGGGTAQMITYLAQLKSCGVLDRIAGILLGTFVRMEEENCRPDMLTLVRSFVGRDMPIAATKEIGHRHGSKAIRIGAEIAISGSPVPIDRAGEMRCNDGAGRL